MPLLEVKLICGLSPQTRGARWVPPGAQNGHHPLSPCIWDSTDRSSTISEQVRMHIYDVNGM